MLSFSAPATGETEGLKPGGVRGPKVMPTFDPTKARANLKKASVAVSLMMYLVGGAV